MTVRVNLLPEARVLKLKNQQTKRVTILICSVVVFGVAGALVVLLLLLGARSFQITQNDKKITDFHGQIDAKKGVEEEVAQFNLALSESSRLSDNRVLISQLFDRLTDALPKNVKLTDLSVDPTYKVKASVQAPDYNTVDLFGNALRSYNVTNKFVKGLSNKAVFTDIVINSVSTGKSGQASVGKVFDVTFAVDKDLVKKFHEDSKAADGGTNGN